MPDAVLMPGPVNAIAWRARWRSAAARVIASFSGKAVVKKRTPTHYFKIHTALLARNGAYPRVEFFGELANLVGYNTFGLEHHQRRADFGRLESQIWCC